MSTKRTKKKAAKKTAKKKPMKKAVLQPNKRKDGKWQVSLGIKIVNGRRTNPRKQFMTRADAQDFCDAEKRRRKAHGEITAGADGVKVAEWMELDSKMEMAGVNTTDVRTWIDLHAKLRKTSAQSLSTIGNRILRDLLSVQKHGTAEECYKAWLAHLGKKKKRGRYMENARNYCRNFIFGDVKPRKEEADDKPEEEKKEPWKGFGAERPVLEISPDVIEDYMGHHPGYFGVISAWLGWAYKYRWLPMNPCYGRRPEEPARGAVATLTNQQTKELLKAAATEEEWEVLAFLVFSLFATLRPEEYRKVSKGRPTLELQWDYLHENGLEIPPDLDKTKAGRVVDLEPVVCDWIKYIRTHCGHELIGPMPNKGWTKTWKAWRKAHWKGKWPQDLLRHTFGSNHLARSQSPEITSGIMGNTPKVLKKHYWNWKTRKKQALVYWGLTPKVVLEK